MRLRLLRRFRYSSVQQLMVKGLVAVQAVGQVLQADQSGVRPQPQVVASAPAAVQSTITTPAPSKRERIVPNRVRPHVTPPMLVPVFGDAPSTAAIRAARILPEPLQPVGSPTAEDNRTIGHLIETYAAGSVGVEALESFTRQNPASPWRASLFANLGTLRASEGFFSRAATYWQEAWELAKTDLSDGGRAVADYALGEWMNQASGFGQTKVLATRLEEAKERKVRGTAGNKVAVARESLWFLTHKHEFAIFSGSEALKVLVERGAGTGRSLDVIQAYRPPHEGTALSDLHALARRANLGLEMRYVERPAEVPLNSVVHLRSEHYSALVARADGHVVLRDIALGGDMMMSDEAFADEASGYALVPKGTRSGRSVAEAEGSVVFGHCLSGPPWDNEPCNCPPGGGGSGPGGPPPKTPGGMPVYTLHPLTASTIVNDLPVGYTPPRGPAIDFHLVYNQRVQRYGQTPTFSHVGAHWSFDWLSYVQDNNSKLVAPYSWVQVLLRGEGSESYNAYSGFTHWKTRATLVEVSHDPPRWERRLPDGTVEVFTFADRAASLPNRKIFLTEVIDPQGQTLTFTYDASVRLVAVTDAVGQVTTLDYQDSADPLRLTRVTDPFGRTAELTYDGSGNLQSITDAIGMTSSFAYGSDGFMQLMTTPYGTTVFRNGDTSGASGFRRIEATDPEGGTERVEFHLTDTAGQDATAPSGEVPAGFSSANAALDVRNSLYWNKQAMAEAPGNVARAVVTRWLWKTEAAYDVHALSRAVPHSVKRPLENRTWYAYPDQPNTATAGTGTQPIAVARVLQDGATQLTQNTFNAQGMVTSTTDPVGRQTVFVYASNGIDLLEVRQTKPGGYDTVASYGSYTAQHMPGTSTDAAGQTTTTTYNTAGQPLTVTNAKSETTTYTYNTDGQLESVTGPVSGATSTYTYDALGRLESVEDADGYTVVTEYDALNRVIKRTYPDDTFEEMTYARLDVVATRDRRGRITRQTYDRAGRLTSTRDPLGRVIRQEWCGCGSLQALVDAKGQRTSWTRDALGRVVTETRADGTTETTYTYDATGRLWTVTDPKGQVTTHSYLADDRLSGTAYTNATIATPSVSFTYDAVYPRVATMVDGIGTTTYTYKVPGQLGAGQVASVDGPLSNDVLTYTYDELGRVATRAIDGVNNTVTWAYDALGRVTSEANLLGTFGYGYDGTSGRLATVSYPNGQTSAYSYLDVEHDLRLQTIHHKYPNLATLSKFDYTYDVVGNILTWRQQADSTAVQWVYGYDAADQLTSAVKWSTGGTPAILQRFAYAYDPAGNRTTEQIDDAVTVTTHDVLNRLQTQSAGGLLTFAGTLNEPATVTIGGRPAVVDPSNAFRGMAVVPSGTSTTTVVARDFSGNQTSQQFQVSQSATGKTFTYDANGNLTSEGTRTFEWDARNQLVVVEVGVHRTEFAYDGAQRRVQIVEKESGTTTSVANIAWCLHEICEERDGGGTVKRRSFEDGEQVIGASRYFSTDHLGSVTIVTDSSPAVLARYAFDPWGRRAVTAGSDATNIGFTGHFWHTNAGAWLTQYRALDPASGRWNNEDPIGLRSGPNLFMYVGNNTVGAWDPDGRAGTAAVGAVVGGTLGGPVGAVAGGVVGAVVGVVIGLELVERLNRCAEEPDCEKQRSDDEQNCRNFSNRRLRALCWGNAMDRYADCLGGKPPRPRYPTH